MSTVQHIAAEAEVHPDGTVGATVGGALLPDANRVPMDEALRVLTRYAATYGTLALTTRFPDGRSSVSTVTRDGVEAGGAAGDPFVGLESNDDLRLLTYMLRSLPEPEEKGRRSIRAPKYKAPGKEEFQASRAADREGIGHNLFRGVDVDPGAPAAPAVQVSKRSRRVPLEGVPEFDVEGDMQRAQTRKNTRPPMPLKAKIAGFVMFGCVIVGFFLLY